MLRTFRVRGIHCPHCVEILEHALIRIPGVRTVRIRGVAGVIQVDCDPYRVNDSMLAAAMRDVGFHPR